MSPRLGGGWEDETFPFSIDEIFYVGLREKTTVSLSHFGSNRVFHRPKGEKNTA